MLTSRFDLGLMLIYNDNKFLKRRILLIRMEGMEKARKTTVIRIRKGKILGLSLSKRERFRIFLVAYIISKSQEKRIVPKVIKSRKQFRELVKRTIITIRFYIQYLNMNHINILRKESSQSL